MEALGPEYSDPGRWERADGVREGHVGVGKVIQKLVRDPGFGVWGAASPGRWRGHFLRSLL